MNPYIEREDAIVAIGRDMRDWMRDTLRFALERGASDLVREAARREFLRRRIFVASSPELLRTG